MNEICYCENKMTFHKNEFFLKCLQLNCGLIYIIQTFHPVFILCIEHFGVSYLLIVAVMIWRITTFQTWTDVRS